MAEVKSSRVISRTIIIIFSIILNLLFLALLVLGIYASIVYKGTMAFSIAIIIISVVGLILSISGYFGSRFEDDDTGRFSVPLVIFFITTIVFCIAFVIIGAACFFIKPTVEYILTLSSDSILKLLPNLSETELSNVKQVIDKMISSLIVVGIISFVVATVTLLVMLVTAFHMGKKLFSRFFVLSWSVISTVLGAGGIYLSIVYYSTHTFFSFQIAYYTAIFSVLLAASIVLLLVGLFGFFVGCCGQGKKLLVVIYLIGVIITLLVFLAVGILDIIGNNQVRTLADAFCNNTDNKCDTLLKNLKENSCKHIKDEMEKKKCEDALTLSDLVSLVSDMLGGWVHILGTISFIIVVFLAFVVVASCFTCVRPAAHGSDLEASLTGYRPQKDKYTPTAY